MNTFLSELALGINPYVPGEQPKEGKFIKLNTNENPYPPSPSVTKVLTDLDFKALRLYPPPECDHLRKALAENFNVGVNNVYVSNGSDELLAWCFPAFFTGKAPILINDITYSFYKVYADLFSVKTNPIPLKNDLSIPLESYKTKNGGIIIANPNAPTGKILNLDELEYIIKWNSDQVVIIDEAYVDFGCESAVGLTKKFPNVLVVQTFSKSRSLAGIRCGFAIGSEQLIGGLQRIKNSLNSYTMDYITLKIAKASIEDTEYFKDTIGKVKRTRERVSGKLRELGFEFPNSYANFLFITHPQVQAQELYDKLYNIGILVRYFKLPRIDNRLRVTIGTDEQMDIFLKSLKDILNII